MDNVLGQTLKNRAKLGIHTTYLDDCQIVLNPGLVKLEIELIEIKHYHDFVSLPINIAEIIGSEFVLLNVNLFQANLNSDRKRIGQC